MEVKSADKFDARSKRRLRRVAPHCRDGKLAIQFQIENRSADLATKNRLPAIYAREDFVDSGGLMSYGADQDEAYRARGIYVDKILKGAKPA